MNHWTIRKLMFQLIVNVYSLQSSFTNIISSDFDNHISCVYQRSKKKIIVYSCDVQIDIIMILT